MATSLKDKAYTIIKERILSGFYEPNTMLNEVALSDELGISRTPIREALNDLEHEMLVNVLPKKGTQVSEINFDVVRDIFQVRMLIEPYILRQFGPLIDKLQLLRIKSIQENAEITGIEAQFESDNDLHQLIISSNPNRYLDESIRKVYDQNQRIRLMTGQKSTKRLIDSASEHIAVIDAILVEDYIKAAEAMEQHLANSWKATLDVLYHV
ncbi:MAG: GntR family transcriptional regulator [Oscillospiraceae bacterium]|nr:GntR family transcriptional regulator [Oscillospiraceae bacterium]